MINSTQVAVAAVTGVLGGGVSALITAHWRIRELQKGFELSQRTRELEDKAKSQLKYLNPLRVAARDLRERLEDADTRICRDDPFLTDTAKEILQQARNPPEEFALWANEFGEYALSTAYMTAVYFARASRIRGELPFVKLSSDDDEELLRHLETVRRALGGELGIWDSLQDSLGRYLYDRVHGVGDYRDFCRQVADPMTGVWYSRLFEFFRDLYKKTPEERARMSNALRDLETFLKAKPHETAQGQ